MFRRNFATLASDQQAIVKLFKDVALQLIIAPEFGLHHPLTEEWDRIRQEHRGVYRESRRHAQQFANFLTQYLDIVEMVSNSESASSMTNRILRMQQFIRDLKDKRRQAESHSDQFNKLKERAECFQAKFCDVAHIDIETGMQSFFTRLWSKIINCCKAIMTAMKKLLDCLVNITRQLSSIVKVIYLQLGPAECRIVLNNYSPLPEDHEMTYPGTARAATDINDDISQLLEKVAGFDVAWDMVIRSCDNLMDWLTLAHRTNTGGLSEFRQLLKRELNKSRKVYFPLMECMRAYSLGEYPTL
ncbi:hypothetical protein C8Q72DRAFT_215919 [Fomitopsis betulina]|nr:hypothetical protein C8Q72DRAFT_215919 [Fomitopsis betulina]